MRERDNLRHAPPMRVSDEAEGCAHAPTPSPHNVFFQCAHGHELGEIIGNATVELLETQAPKRIRLFLENVAIQPASPVISHDKLRPISELAQLAPRMMDAMEAVGFGPALRALDDFATRTGAEIDFQFVDATPGTAAAHALEVFDAVEGARSEILDSLFFERTPATRADLDRLIELTQSVTSLDASAMEARDDLVGRQLETAGFPSSDPETLSIVLVGYEHRSCTRISNASVVDLSTTEALQNTFKRCNVSPADFSPIGSAVRDHPQKHCSPETAESLLLSIVLGNHIAVAIQLRAHANVESSITLEDKATRAFLADPLALVFESPRRILDEIFDLNGGRGSKGFQVHCEEVLNAHISRVLGVDLSAANREDPFRPLVENIAEFHARKLGRI